MRKLITLTLIFLTFAVPVLAQDDDLTETYTSDREDLIISYPEGWQVVVEDGLTFVVNGDAEIIEEDVLPSGAAAMVVFTPDLLGFLDIEPDAEPAEAVETLGLAFVLDEGELGMGEVEVDDEAEHEIAIAPISFEAGDGLVAAIAFETGTIAVISIAAYGELEDVEPTFRAILGSMIYQEPTAVEEPEDNAISWQTDNVSLTASNFYIAAGGQVFTADVDDVEVDGDPGTESYTTLEVTWEEHGVEMRMFMYFEATPDEWNVSEIRIYDGSEDGEWITFDDQDFGADRGEAYTVASFAREFFGNVIHFNGLGLQAFIDAE